MTAVGVCLSLIGLGPSFGATEPAPASGNWLRQVTEDIRLSEYNFASREDRSFSAPNRSQNLRSVITPSEIRLTNRAEGTVSWSLSLRLASFGRAGALASVAAADMFSEANRIEVRRAGLTEWYLNDERGLEQGFTILRPLEGADPSGPLVIEMAIEGSVQAYPDELGQSVLFKDSSGQAALLYRDLRAVDRDGLVLASKLVVRPGKIQIVVDDAEAAYPIEIDPLMVNPVWSVPGGQAGAKLGASVSVAGDVNGDGRSDIVVGAPAYDNGQTDEGRAFLYLGTSAGPSLAAAWTAEADQAGAEFGHSVAGAGDVNGDGFGDVIVGAPFYDNGQSNEGRTYTYLGSASGLAITASRIIEINQTGAQFGISVAGAGDVNGDGFDDVIVGANQYTNGQQKEGGAFVYLGSASGLGASSAWSAEANENASEFGGAVASVGDVNGDGFSDVIVGAPAYKNGENEEGRAFVYAGSSSGPSSTALWTNESNQANARYGAAVGAAGDTNGDGFADIIVGCPNFDNGSQDEGAAFVYFGSASAIATTANWDAEGNQVSASYGSSVGTAGDVDGDGFSDIVVGAPLYDNGQTDEGRAFLYAGRASGPSRTVRWSAEGEQNDAQLGSWVATAGDVNGDGYSDVLVGASNFNLGEGRVNVYLGSSAGLSATAGWSAEGEQYFSYFAYRASLASAGDVNGDGFGDVIIGAGQFDYDQTNEGRAYVHFGSPSGLSTTPSWFAEGNQDNALFGNAVASAGDVNGDGYDDIVIGALDYNNGMAEEGRAYVYLGSPTGPGAVPAWITTGDQIYGRYGSSVASAGDVNGDGYSDVLIGADLYINYSGSQGKVSLYLGSASGLSTVPAWIGHDDKNSVFGSTVASAGDVNGDGYSDVIISAPNYYEGYFGLGRSYVFHGSPGGLPASPNWYAQGTHAPGYYGDFGLASVTAGDVNGDGFSDVLIGDRDYDNGNFNEGRALLYLGSASGLVSTPAWTFEGNRDLAEIGTSISSAGDVNNDGYSDVAIGDSAGAEVWVFHGSASGLPASPTQTLTGGDYFGGSVASAGDINGDGFNDLIVGAPFMSNGINYEGGAFSFYGNESEGLDRTPRQARANGTALISLLGKSESQTAFRLRASGRTPEGRGKLRLQWEVKPLGSAFDGTGLQAGSLVDTGAPAAGGSAASVDETAGGLEPGTPYHWRVRFLTENQSFPRSPWFTFPYNGWTETDLRTGCDAVAPAGSPLLTVVRSGNDALLSWSGVGGANIYDVVRGDLAALHGLGGDFSQATDACVANDLAATSVVVAAIPPVGDGLWFLVRGIDKVGTRCASAGTYDTGFPSQVAPRDGSIAASGADCP